MQCWWILSFVGLAYAADWSYSGDYGPDFWHEKFADHCSGSRQSPIDIPATLTTDTSMGSFAMTGYDSMSTGSNLTVTNNGHTVQVDVTGTLPSLSGGGLSGTYEALQLHFHWGPTSSEGSEHTFRGRQYPLELHVVHKKTTYATVTEALANGDGLAVLGFFFVISDDDNTALDPLINALSNVRFKSDTEAITIDFTSIMPTTMDEYYRYLGSLTTPTCDEAVVWTVFENKNTISEAQMAKFRELYENEAGSSNRYMTLNYRPTQNLNARTVSKSYSEDVPSSFHWGYHDHEGPEYWKDYYDTCEGTQQSPINIPKGESSSIAAYNSNLGLDTLEFRNYDATFTGTIHNNGHTIQVDIPDGTDLILAEGGLPATYRAAQFHFHWGTDNNHGSEHTFQGASFPLEMHIVHYKESYGTLGSAVTHTDGLAVVGFFFQVVSDPNTDYADLIANLLDVKYKGASKDITGVNLLSLTKPDLHLNATTGEKLPFFRYQGGLTTPPCSEVVTWTVMRNYIPISAAQVAAFRDVTHITSGTVTDDDKIKENYRPIQSLVSRKVYASFDYLATTGASSTLYPSICTMAAVLILGLLFNSRP